ncbi:unnamed protein product [Vicia faba]|uniref:Uncharacterized protein n=1 Tax=Vicia faba TaxID=3906 RepID=A0AAV1A5U5_VICFA|nr:unnamed protein product [Vicia faba]
MPAAPAVVPLEEMETKTELMLEDFITGEDEELWEVEEESWEKRDEDEDGALWFWFDTITGFFRHFDHQHSQEPVFFPGSTRVFFEAATEEFKSCNISPDIQFMSRLTTLQATCV